MTVAASGSGTASTIAKEPVGPRRPLALRLLHVLGSMKLAVVLLVLLALLTWLGTLAQIDKGLWATQREYFESWFVEALLPVSWWGGETLFTISLPLPGAYPVMALLFVNLVVGGMLRLRWQVRNVGVLIVHLGIALLLIAGMVKLEVGYSGHLALYEAPAAGNGQVAHRVYQSSTFVSFHEHELALSIDRGDTIVERVVSESELAAAKVEYEPPAARGTRSRWRAFAALLRGLFQGEGDGTVTVAGEGLPFRIEVHHWFDNCRPLPKGPMFQAEAPVIDLGDGGPGVFLQPTEPYKEREHNRAGCYVTVVTDDGKRLETILDAADSRPFDDRRAPFTFTVGGQRYGLDLRRIVYDLPFTVRLDKFQKSDHPGTTMARDFRSFVTVFEDGAERPAQIFMNNPLRKGGFVLYQTNWGPQQGGGPPWYSVFEVADNPSDKWPEIACWVIAVGLLIHFVRKLVLFLRSSARAALTN